MHQRAANNIFRFKLFFFY
ncbi:hypothetical protein NU768_002648 [Vibrio vulnificus]|nr:hypothetical protein [Vibrio vulnificus]